MARRRGTSQRDYVAQWSRYSNALEVMRSWPVPHIVAANIPLLFICFMQWILNNSCGRVIRAEAGTQAPLPFTGSVYLTEVCSPFSWSKISSSSGCQVGQPQEETCRLPWAMPSHCQSTLMGSGGYRFRLRVRSRGKTIQLGSHTQKQLLILSHHWLDYAAEAAATPSPPCHPPPPRIKSAPGETALVAAP